jgi:hypothetical protein
MSPKKSNGLSRKWWRTRCLIPDFDGAVFSLKWREALWDKLRSRDDLSNGPEVDFMDTKSDTELVLRPSPLPHADVPTPTP